MSSWTRPDVQELQASVWAIAAILAGSWGFWRVVFAVLSATNLIGACVIAYRDDRAKKAQP